MPSIPNILVYAHRSESPYFDRASACLAGLAERNIAWGIPWPCLHEFLAVVTHARIHRPPTPMKRAIEQVETWLSSPRLVPLGETESHWRELRSLVTASGIIGPRIHDARITAICVQHGVRELWSADRDFSRFGDLRVVNPLI